MTVRFLHPEMAVWLLVLPACFAVWFANYWYKRRSRRLAAVAPRFQALSRRTLSRRTGGRHDAAVLILAVSAVGLLVAALTRPQVLRDTRTAAFERQDLVLILDRSVSMRARDIRPSRAGRALIELRHFLQRKPDAIDRIGLVGFAGTSLVLSYLTSDVDSLLFYLEWVDEDPSVLYGTDVGAALSSALEIVQRDRRPTRKLFLVISDGEDNGGTLAGAVAAVRAAHIRVHCIGIGSDEEAVLPVPRADGRDVFLKDDTGRLVTTRFSETTLKSLASATGGRYLRSVTGRELLSALDAIVAGEARQTGWRTTTEYRDVYLALFAAAGVAVVGLGGRL